MKLENLEIALDSSCPAFGDFTNAVPISAAGMQVPRLEDHLGDIDYSDRKSIHRCYGKVKDRFAEDADYYNSYAWSLLTTPDRTKEDIAKAVKLAEKANSLSGECDWYVLDTLACAYSVNGELEKAWSTILKAGFLSSWDEQVAVDALTISRIMSKKKEDSN